MSEQYPLLPEEGSEEEHLNPRVQRRLLMSRARAKNHVKGAAVIIKRWTGHWTTLLNCLCLGIGMIALSIFIMYNCLYSYTMLSPPFKKHTKHQAFQNSIKLDKVVPKSPQPPTVYMHILANDKLITDLNDYLPYINILTNKYKHFKYELIIISNDTEVDNKIYSEKANNELALKMLWADDLYYKEIINKQNNLEIKYYTLSEYLHDSPLKMHWRSLPDKFIPFLIRAISVWNKGGIAFDPITLTPKTPHSVYINKINNILNKYKTKIEKEKKPLHTKLEQASLIHTSSEKEESHTKPNNIQDVINALKHDVGFDKSIQKSLDEAETNNEMSVIFTRKLRSVAATNIKNKDKTQSMKISKMQENHDSIVLHHKEMSAKDLSNERQNASSPTLHLLPKFIDFLFHNTHTKTKIRNSNDTTIIDKIDNKREEKVSLNDANTQNKNISLNMHEFWNEIRDKNNYKPMIISAKGILDYPSNATKEKDVIEKETKRLFELTIDLKGNIIATDTACHSFIGGIFSNAVHHNKTESITDFIIKELSVFCHGLLASCFSIDVILL